MKKQIFVGHGEHDGKIFGPDVISFPEYCAVKGFIFDKKGQIDMNPAWASAVMSAFEEKKFISMGDFGLRTDGGVPEIIETMTMWILFHLHPVRTFWGTKKADMPKYARKLSDAGYQTIGWDGLI